MSKRADPTERADPTVRELLDERYGTRGELAREARAVRENGLGLRAPDPDGPEAGELRAARLVAALDGSDYGRHRRRAVTACTRRGCGEPATKRLTRSDCWRTPWYGCDVHAAAMIDALYTGLPGGTSGGAFVVVDDISGSARAGR